MVSLKSLIEVVKGGESPVWNKDLQLKAGLVEGWGKSSLVMLCKKPFKMAGLGHDGASSDHLPKWM